MDPQQKDIEEDRFKEQNTKKTRKLKKEKQMDNELFENENEHKHCLLFCCSYVYACIILLFVPLT